MVRANCSSRVVPGATEALSEGVIGFADVEVAPFGPDAQLESTKQSSKAREARMNRRAEMSVDHPIVGEGDPPGIRLERRP